jgi:predicted RND superfamily exporter protein
MTRLLAWPAHHPLRALLIVLLVVIVATFGVFHLTPDPSLEGLFANNDPAAAALLRVLNNFSSAEDLLLLVSFPDAQPNPTTSPSAPEVQKLLAFAQRLDGAVRTDLQASQLSTGFTYRADADTRAFFEKVLVPNGLFYLDDGSFDAALHRLSKDEIAKQIQQNQALISAPGPAAQALSKAFLQDPLRLHEFILDQLKSQRPFETYQNSDAFLSKDGRSLLIRIAGRRPPSDLDFCKHFTATIESLVAQVNTDHLQVEYAGSYAIAAASERSIRHDMIVGVISSVICLQILFILAYRGALKFFALAFTPVAAGIVCGFGAYRLYSPLLSPMTAVIGGILAGMGIDYSIQYLSQYESRRNLPPMAAAESTASAISFGLFGAFVTSIFGFVAIGISSVKALRDFSILGTLGLCGAFACTVLLLSALAILTDRRPTPLPKTQSRLRFEIDPLLSLLSQGPRIPILLVSLILIASIIPLFAPGELLPLESDLKVMHPQPNAPLDAQAEIARRFGASPDSLIVHLQSDSPANLLHLAHEVDRALHTDGPRRAGVRATYGLATLLPDPSLAPSRIARTGSAFVDRVLIDFHTSLSTSIFDPAAFKPYETFLRHLLTQSAPPAIPSLLPYKKLGETILPKTAFLPTAPPPTEAITLVFFNKSLDDADSRDSAIASIRASLSDLPTTTLTGISVLGHDAQLTVHRDLPRLILLAVAIIVAYHFLHFRSVPDAILALLPTFFSLIFLLAFLRITHQKINMMNLVAFPLLIGINVDYGIFLISSVRRRHVRDLSVSDLITRLAPASHAVLLCAASTLFGFGSLYFTRVPAIRSLGLAVAVGILACVAGIFLLTIPILLLLAKRNDPRP